MTSNFTKAVAIILHTITGLQGFEIWVVWPYDRRELLVTISPTVSLDTARKIAGLFALQYELSLVQEN